VAAKIAEGQSTLGEINAAINALAPVLAAQRGQQPSAEQTRRLVPRAAGILPAGRQPSLQTTAGAEASGESDEWLVGEVE
jgi:hypothetical protein